MKNINHLLLILLFISSLISCNINTEETDGITNSNYGLQKGECIAVKCFIDGELITTTTYNADTKTYSLKSKTANLTYQFKNDVLVQNDIYTKGNLLLSKKYSYNDMGYVSKIETKRKEGKLPEVITYKYNATGCPLATKCKINIKEVKCEEYQYNETKTCLSYTINKDDGFKTTEMNIVNPDDGFKTTEVNIVADNKNLPIAKLELNMGNKNGNILSTTAITYGVDKSKFNIRKAEIFDVVYNAQGYPLSYNYREGRIKSPNKNAEVDYQPHEKQEYQYFCFE